MSQLKLIAQDQLGMRLRRPDSVLGEALRMSVLVVLYPILGLEIIVLIASLFGPIPAAYADFILVIIVGVGGLFLFKQNLPKEGLKVNKTNEWVALVTLVGVVFVLGQTLLALSSFYTTTVTQSKCYDPAYVNVTSPNCKIIQTTSIPEYSILGSYGVLVLTVAVIWTLVFAGLSGLYYIVYTKPRTEPCSDPTHDKFCPHGPEDERRYL